MLAATLAVILVVGTKLAVAQSALINSTLKCKTYEIVSDGGDDGDTNYFPTTYSTAEDVKAYGLSVCEEVEGEGIVQLKNDNGALPLDKPWFFPVCTAFVQVIRTAIGRAPCFKDHPVFASVHTVRRQDGLVERNLPPERSGVGLCRLRRW